jgi:hypothetical protein
MKIWSKNYYYRLTTLSNTKANNPTLTKHNSSQRDQCWSIALVRLSVTPALIRLSITPRSVRRTCAFIMVRAASVLSGGVQFKVGKKLWVRQMPHAVTCIVHGVGLSRNVVEGRDVAGMTLMEGFQAKESVRRATGRCGAFPLPPQGSHVVRRIVNVCFSHIIALGQNIMSGHTCN